MANPTVYYSTASNSGNLNWTDWDNLIGSTDLSILYKTTSSGGYTGTGLVINGGVHNSPYSFPYSTMPLVGSWTSPFDNPIAIASDPSNNVYVCNFYNGYGSSVTKIASNGTSTGITFTGLPASNGNCRAIAVDPTGAYLYYVTYNWMTAQTVIRKTTVAGAYVSEWNIGTSFSTGALATSSNGYVYLLDTLAKKVVRYTATGSYLGQFNISYSATGMDLDTSNNVYVAYGSTVQKFSSTGSLLSEFYLGGGGNNIVGGQGFKLDSSNNIYIIESVTKYLKKYSSSGTLLETSSSSIATNSGGLAITSDDYVYVSYASANQVYKLRKGAYPSQSSTLTSGFANNTNYWFALQVAGASPILHEFTNITTIPGTPTGVATTAINSNSVTLTWNSMLGGGAYPVTYTIYKDGSPTPAAFSSTTSVTINSLSANTSYSFTVKTTANGVDSGLSAPLAVTTLVAAPAAPTGLSAGAFLTNGSGFTLSWNASATAATYYVYDNTILKATVTAPTTSAAISGFLPNSSHPMKVVAANAGGSSPDSASLSVVTLPLAPTSLVYNNVATDNFDLSWNAPTYGAARYQVYDGATPYGIPIAATSINVSGLNPNSSHSMTVKALNINNGESVASSLQSIITLPLAPTNLGSNNVAEDNFNLSWSAPTYGAAKYQVYNGATPYGLTTTENTLNISGLTPNSSYSMTVKALNANNGESVNSSIYTVLTLPSAPSSLVASNITEGSVDLTWTAPANGAETYKVFQDLDPVPVVTTPSTNATIAGLLPETSYLFAVASANTTGESTQKTSDTFQTLIAQVGALFYYYNGAVEIPLYATKEGVCSAVRLNNETVYMKLVPTTDPNASKLMFRINGETLAAKL